MIARGLPQVPFPKIINHEAYSRAVFNKSPFPRYLIMKDDCARSSTGPLSPEDDHSLLAFSPKTSLRMILYFCIFHQRPFWGWSCAFWFFTEDLSEDDPLFLDFSPKACLMMIICFWICHRRPFWGWSFAFGFFTIDLPEDDHLLLDFSPKTSLGMTICFWIF